jgi:hypothetical protein
LIAGALALVIYSLFQRPVESLLGIPIKTVATPRYYSQETDREKEASMAKEVDTKGRVYPATIR